MIGHLMLGVCNRILLPHSSLYQLSYTQAIEIRPGEAAQMLHQDDTSYLIPRPRAECGLLFGLALTDFTEENEATRFVPGSHCRPLGGTCGAKASPRAPSRSSSRTSRTGRSTLTSPSTCSATASRTNPTTRTSRATTSRTCAPSATRWGLDRVHLSGESLGAWVAARFAATYPERVRKIVLNTAADVHYDPAASPHIRELSMNAVIEPTRDNIRKRLKWLVCDPRLVTDEMVELRFRVYSQQGFSKAMEHIMCLHTPEYRLPNMLTEEEMATVRPRSCCGRGQVRATQGPSAISSRA